MTGNRPECVSEGAIAIIIMAIMVSEMNVSQDTSLADLQPLLPVFLCYVLSFIYVGIYWSNHDHMLHTVKRIDGILLRANLHGLFWFALFPFVTGWMVGNHFETLPPLLYVGVLLLAATAFKVLQGLLVAANGRDAGLMGAPGSDRKGSLSTVACVLGIGLAFVYHWMANAVFAFIACIGFVPDHRFEKVPAQ